LGYCAEGDINNPDLEDTLDHNAKLFTDSARLMESCQDHMISIKMTGLLDVRVIYKWNEAVLNRDELWSKHSHNGTLSYQGLLSGLQGIVA
jgi:hypothetical protein